MKRYAFFPIFALLCASLFLQACQTTGGGYQRVWQASGPQKPAEAAPSELSDFGTETAALQSEIPADDRMLDDDMNPGFTRAQPELPPAKVALLVPLTGQNAKLGQSLLQAAQIALFDVGHTTFELMPLDTKGTPDGARMAANRAIEQGAQLVLGPLFAQSVRAAQPVVNRGGVNMIAFSTDWTLANNNTFMMGFLPFDQVERILRFAAQNSIFDVGVLAPTTDYGDVVLSAYNNNANIYGLNTLRVDRFSSQSQSLSVTLRRFADYDNREEGTLPPPYQAVFMPFGGDQARTVGNLMSQYGLQPSQVKRLGTGLWDDRSLATERALDGSWFAAPSPSLRQSFERRYFEVYGVSPPRLSTLAYDATALAAVLARKGLQERGRPAFDYQSLTNPNGFAGVDGIFRFRANGLVERGLAILEYNSGTITIIDDAPRTFERREF